MALATLSPLASGQDVDELRELLREALDKVSALEARVSELEGHDPDDPDALLEAQLLALTEVEPEAAPRTVFPSVNNPRISVFMDATADMGDYDEKLGDGEGDRFSLRETEVDFRLPLSPFAEGVLVAVYEDVGNGEFEAKVEEGFANISLDQLLGIDTAARAQLGRFRVPFGHDNVLHVHDLLQVDRPLAVSEQFGPEGLIGDGFVVHTPVNVVGEEDVNTTTVSLGLVNGEMFIGEEGVLAPLGEDVGVELDSDSPVMVARVSNFTQFDQLSDVEVGASYIRDVGGNAIQSDSGDDIEPAVYGVDVTARLRDEESGVGGWVLSAEAIRSDYDFGNQAPGFPSGSQQVDGFWLTAQRQLSQNHYVGLRYGESEVFGSRDDVAAISPYWSWYPNEFFRVRVQGQHIDYDADGTGDADVNRLLFQFTWNFGTHMPHPYWVNQ